MTDSTKTTNQPSHGDEVVKGERFEFGENWSKFLSLLNDERILSAESSLKSMLKLPNLSGMTFLDIGSGSGLFSLCARRLDAVVTSFDYDPKSVACAIELKNRYYPDDPRWSISEGSILDTAFVNELGKYDIVYSWGVLHHTGAMWSALDIASKMVKQNGYLFIALYNDQGSASERWKIIKKFYCGAPSPIKSLLEISLCLRNWWKIWLKDFFSTGNPLKTWNSYGKTGRGMSPWRDIVDWIGGYPFEVAKPGDVVDFFSDRGFVLQKITTTNSLGCNQFVMTKSR